MDDPENVVDETDSDTPTETCPLLDEEQAGTHLAGTLTLTAAALVAIL